MNLTILDNVTGGAGDGTGVLPYLPLNELGRQRSAN